jgi:hypothetical protein
LQTPKSVWDKLNTAVSAAGSGTQQSRPRAPSSRADRWSPWKWRAVNAAATVAWIYAVCKILIFDIDQYAFQWLWPQGGWIVTYRFFILLTVASVLAIVLRRLSFFAWLIYFAFFPMIVVIWWLPRFIYKRRSWVALLAVVNVVTTFIQDFRYSLVTKSAALISIAVIVVSPIRALTVLAGAVLLFLLMVTYVRTVSIVLRPSRFLSGQQSAIDKIVASDGVTKLWVLSDELKDPQIVRFDADQMSRFTVAVSWGVVVHRALYFWAYQLESYRKGAAPYMFGLLSYLWLFVQTVVAFAFVNFALFRVDPTTFTFTTAPGLFEFFHYAVNIVLNGSIVGLEPRSQLAVALGDIGRLTGPVLLLTVIATFALSFKQSRQDAQMQESIARIKARGRQFDAEFQNQYEVTVTEAVNRLRKLPGAVLGFAAWFSRQIPPGFEEQ